MNRFKKYGTQITILICCLFIVLSCNNSPEEDVTKPPVNEHMQDSAKVDSSQALMPQAGPHKFIVEIKKMQFNPGELSIQKGDTVIWINYDLTNHCITDINKSWTSAPIVPGKYWQKAFNKSADYYCALHLVMKGKVVVQ